jgi:hypothetical protein
MLLVMVVSACCLFGLDDEDGRLVRRKPITFRDGVQQFPWCSVVNADRNITWCLGLTERVEP